MATIDADGVMQIRDRAKDVIKTGGEWISSIDLETPRWATRRGDGGGDRRQAPEVGRAAADVRRAPGQSAEEDILAFLAERVAKWWVPDDVVFPRIAAGGRHGQQKGDLRKQYGGCSADGARTHASSLTEAAMSRPGVDPV